jgi:hypothetical protein
MAYRHLMGCPLEPLDTLDKIKGVSTPALRAGGCVFCVLASQAFKKTFLAPF